jgi:nitroimidazol reductase NimA-like FMN-containing flavoprotein (pyridoxamine 5'-phosphate oxidase superfamily)
MRSNLSAKEKRYLARARVCRVGTADRRGTPHTAPLCHAFDPGSRTAYIFTDENGVTAKNLRARGRGALECDDYFENWKRLRGLVAHVRSKEIRDGRELRRAGDLLKKKFKQYRGEEIDYVIGLHVEEIASWGL